MKKIEASLIKRLMRINWDALRSSFFLGFSLEQGKEKQVKEGQGNKSKDQARKSRIKHLQQEYLHVKYCICVFLSIFDMHEFAYWCMVVLLSVAWFRQVMIVVFSLTLPFLDAMICLDVYLGFEIWFFGWILESGAKVISRFIPKGLGIP